jgi:hypothetical protein
MINDLNNLDNLNNLDSLDNLDSLVNAIKIQMEQNNNFNNVGKLLNNYVGVDWVNYIHHGKRDG